MARTLGERGQITIEKAIREELGINAGDLAVQRVQDGKVVIEFVPAPHRRSLAGALRDAVRPVSDGTDWHRVKDYADTAADPTR